MERNKHVVRAILHHEIFPLNFISKCFICNSISQCSILRGISASNIAVQQNLFKIYLSININNSRQNIRKNLSSQYRIFQKGDKIRASKMCACLNQHLSEKVSTATEYYDLCSCKIYYMVVVINFSHLS